MNYKILQFALIAGLIWISNIYAQDNSIDCDNFHAIWNSHCISIEKLPMPEIPITQIQKDFLNSIDSNIYFETVYLQLKIDTLGNVLCSYVLKGNNNFIDTVAMNCFSKIKFSPAENHGIKIPVQVSIPLQGRRNKN